MWPGVGGGDPQLEDATGFREGLEPSAKPKPKGEGACETGRGSKLMWCWSTLAMAVEGEEKRRRSPLSRPEINHRARKAQLLHLTV